MARLIYFTPTSLDGWIGDGEYDWSVPSDEVMAFINDLVRSSGTHLIGRRNYETMAVWETPEVFPDPTPVIQDFASIWQTADKIIYSRTLKSVSTRNTRLEREFDAQAVRALKERSTRDLMVGGPNLASQAIRAGLVDELHLLVAPIVLGGGIRVLPTGARVSLDLLDQRRFADGFVSLRYSIAGNP